MPDDLKGEHRNPFDPPPPFYSPELHRDASPDHHDPDKPPAPKLSRRVEATTADLRATLPPLSPPELAKVRTSALKESLVASAFFGTLATWMLRRHPDWKVPFRRSILGGLGAATLGGVFSWIGAFEREEIRARWRKQTVIDEERRRTGREGNSKIELGERQRVGDFSELVPGSDSIKEGGKRRPGQESLTVTSEGAYEEEFKDPYASNVPSDPQPGSQRRW